MKPTAYAIAALSLALALSCSEAAAQAGGALPWEGPLEQIARSITGPVAFVISLIGITVAGAMLIWGGEINEFARRLIMLVLVISLIVFSSSILQQLFNVSGGAGGL